MLHSSALDAQLMPADAHCNSVVVTSEPVYVAVVGIAMDTTFEDPENASALILNTLTPQRKVTSANDWQLEKALSLMVVTPAGIEMLVNPDD